MKITVAKSSGFCSGVQHAVDTALSIDAENTYLLGELIHNPSVTQEVASRGIRTVESAEEVPDGATLICVRTGWERVSMRNVNGKGSAWSTVPVLLCGRRRR